MDTTDRLRGAIWGQFVGDAAALGSHWIYDLAEMAKQYPEGVNGFETPHEGHYHFGRKPGDQTHYGDGALVLLESLAKEGRFDAKAFGASFVQAFHPASYRGYLDKATKGTLEHYEAFIRAKSPGDFDFQQGADDDQLAGASRLAALVVRYRKDPNLLSIVEMATRVCQDNSQTVAVMKFNALLLIELFRGHNVGEALHRVEDLIEAIDPVYGVEARQKSRQALAHLAEDVVKATSTFGQGCPLPKSFPSAIHTLLKHSENFEEAIVATLRAGGDSAGRGALVGGWLGAHLGLEAIPKAWRSKLSHADRIEAAAEKVIADTR
jgi:ADP-ribosyl-[dinitrogen reductase] hydrolase